ncbi:hypothetical protein SAMN05421876_102409 [Kaistella jeonii]|uniref:Uncharacterized protein n=1 Tax=Kaistella jeonii TaxID=266749 RepID=A0A0C1D7J8_9FLAO|nr:hypothetical protein OA86_04445 [Kaistella jeonii]SFB82014.1 hypothetical protein SAMN05421876_102409 [Kaistella jeonii]VEI96110.1 Uncharacterised protein [Kaistella jeonii]
MYHLHIYCNKKYEKNSNASRYLKLSSEPKWKRAIHKTTSMMQKNEENTKKNPTLKKWDLI